MASAGEARTVRWRTKEQGQRAKMGMGGGDEGEKPKERERERKRERVRESGDVRESVASNGPSERGKQ